VCQGRERRAGVRRGPFQSTVPGESNNAATKTAGHGCESWVGAVVGLSEAQTQTSGCPAQTKQTYENELDSRRTQARATEGSLSAGTWQSRKAQRSTRKSLEHLASVCATQHRTGANRLNCSLERYEESGSIKFFQPFLKALRRPDPGRFFSLFLRPVVGLANTYNSLSLGPGLGAAMTAVHVARLYSPRRVAFRSRPFSLGDGASCVARFSAKGLPHARLFPSPRRLPPSSPTSYSTFHFPFALKSFR